MSLGICGTGLMLTMTLMAAVLAPAPAAGAELWLMPGAESELHSHFLGLGF